MKVVTFGEIMLRLNPIGRKRIMNAESYEAYFGGAEANVAAALAQLGLEAYFVSKLPENELGKAAESYLKKFGVKTDHICWGEGRLGKYFLEFGAAQRPHRVIYDRENSVFSKSNLDDYNWDKIFHGANWFHVSGITPALGKNLPEITLEAVKKAKKMGLSVSLDLNYRKNLWSKDEASLVITSLMKYVDILIGNEEDAQNVFGINSQNIDVHAGHLSPEGYIEIARKLKNKFDLKTVAITLRESLSATVNNWSAMIYEDEGYVFSEKYHLDYIVDRVGAGDAFAAGLIYGFTKKFSIEEKVNFAVAFSALKHSIPGDFNIATEKDVHILISNKGSGRIER